MKLEHMKLFRMWVTCESTAYHLWKTCEMKLYVKLERVRNLNMWNTPCENSQYLKVKHIQSATWNHTCKIMWNFYLGFCLPALKQWCLVGKASLYMLIYKLVNVSYKMFHSLAMCGKHFRETMSLKQWFPVCAQPKTNFDLFKQTIVSNLNNKRPWPFKLFPMTTLVLKLMNLTFGAHLQDKIILYDCLSWGM